LAGSLEKTLSNLDSTLTGFDKTMTSVRGVVSPDAPAVGNLENALKEVSAMSRSLRELSDLLEQQPESLLRGKKKTGGR
jgi:paraquat-inducible protein B